MQEWLRKELFGINEEIDRSVQQYENCTIIPVLLTTHAYSNSYEQQKMEIKTRQEVYLNQLSEKVNATAMAQLHINRVYVLFHKR